MSPSPLLRIAPVGALILTIYFMLVQAATAQVLAFSTSLGFPADVVTIVATFDAKGARVSALGGDIQFDPDAFSAKGCSLSPAIAQKSLAINLVNPNVERFILFGLNQAPLPNGVLFTCKFLILRGGSTSALSIQTVSAADPQGGGVPVVVTTGSIIVLSDATKSNASGQCNADTCRSAIASCEVSHGCEGLRGGAAASCRKDCRQGVIAACQANRAFSLCEIELSGAPAFNPHR